MSRNTAEIKSAFRQRLQEVYTPSEIHQLYRIFMEERLGSTAFSNWDMHTVAEGTAAQLAQDIAELATGKPYQYILGKVDFYGLPLDVTPHVLIPRPETEELVELVMQELRDADRNVTRKILDIGTGSGALAIAVAKHLPCTMTALDISEEALAVARTNAVKNGVTIHFHQMDYLECSLEDTYDVFLSNPPYIGTDEIEEIDASVYAQEPHMALYAPATDVLAFYRKIARDAANHLTEGGWIFLEINQKYGKETLDLFINFRMSEVRKDLSGNDRFLIVRK